MVCTKPTSIVRRELSFRDCSCTPNSTNTASPVSQENVFQLVSLCNPSLCQRYPQDAADYPQHVVGYSHPAPTLGLILVLVRKDKVRLTTE
jgi:hypothetical protein